MREAWHDIAQVCINGHVVNSCVSVSPEHCQDFCDKCGNQTIQHCPSCHTPIRGEYHVPGVISFSHYTPPHYCLKCGHPFPWTDANIKAAKELAKEIEEFDQADIDLLTANLDDLVSEAPNTQVAAIRIKKLLAKASKPVGDAFYKLLVDVISEAARKTIWPDQQ